jgi:hypothetical protein
VITEALIHDDRIQSVSEFQIKRDSDKLYVTFTVLSGEQSIEQEVTI